MVIQIESTLDPRLAPYRDVGRPAALLERALFVAEGRLVVERLLADGRFAVESILVTPAAFDALAGWLSAAPCDVLVADRQVIEGVTGFDFHRGCLALARRPAREAPLDGFHAASRLLALEGVANPDNVGGLFRVASALGADGVLLDHASGDPLYRKAIRTSMAASLRIPFTRLSDWHDSLGRLRAAGFRLVALTPASDATAIASVSRGAKDILLLGAEAQGLSDKTMALADLRVRIPVDQTADSLNVVVAAGIAMHVLR